MPIEPQETIKFDKRPRKATSDIIDIYSNEFHIGMFIGIVKEKNVLKFGPTGLNMSHRFRNVLEYGFTRLLEYYGVNDVDKIMVEKPEDPEFCEFLENLGFVLKGKYYEADIAGDKLTEFLTKIDANYPSLLDRKGQIKNVILRNMSIKDEKTADIMTEKIIEKIRSRTSLGLQLWNYKSIIQLKNIVSAAYLQRTKDVFHDYVATKILKDKLLDEEFVDFFIKTIIGSFETYLREPYLEELFKTIDGKAIFPVPYFHDLIMKVKEMIPEELEKIDRDYYRQWVKRNLPAWQIREKLQMEKLEQIKKNSILTPGDFGTVIQEPYKEMVDALVSHYNDEKVFFGIPNTFK